MRIAAKRYLKFASGNVQTADGITGRIKNSFFSCCRLRGGYFFVRTAGGSSDKNKEEKNK
jgi:hypothetical protein